MKASHLNNLLQLRLIRIRIPITIFPIVLFQTRTRTKAPRCRSSHREGPLGGTGTGSRDSVNAILVRSRGRASPAGGARSKEESRTAATDSAESAEPAAPARRRPRGARPGAKASIHTPPPAEPRRRRSLPGARPPAAGSWRTAGRKDGPTDTPPLPLGPSAGDVLAWELAWERTEGL